MSGESLTYAYGEAGKRAVMAFFREHGYIVEDLGHIREYRNVGVDFSIAAEGEKRYMNVVTDAMMSFTDNMVIETLLHRGDRIEPGWFATCRAQLLAYLDGDSGRLFVCDWAMMRRLIIENRLGERRVYHDRVDAGTIAQAQFITVDEIRNSPALKLERVIDVSGLPLRSKTIPF